MSTIVRIAEALGVSTDYLIDPDTDLPKEVIIEDKTAQEQLRLISQLDEDDKQFVFQMIDKILTNKKFKTFFQENMQK